MIIQYMSAKVLGWILYDANCRVFVGHVLINALKDVTHLNTFIA